MKKLKKAIMVRLERLIIIKNKKRKKIKGASERASRSPAKVRLGQELAPQASFRALQSNKIKKQNKTNMVGN
ncbi:MAG: hypothetical protein LBT59_01560 [Clostridiales bacterium]|jgi:hypothetical protein|nr:hypothetical protein [Clostridiales bacterium]